MCGAGRKDAGGVEEDGKGGRRIGGCGNHFRRIDLGGDFRTDPGRLRAGEVWLDGKRGIDYPEEWCIFVVVKGCLCHKIGLTYIHIGRERG